MITKLASLILCLLISNSSTAMSRAPSIAQPVDKKVEICTAKIDPPTIKELRKDIAKPKKVETELNLDRTKAKQGEFFQAIVNNIGKKPRFWFNSKEYSAYEIEEKTYRALIPVENLTAPGKYSILAKTGSWSKSIPVEIFDNGKGISKITLSADKSGISASKKELREVGNGLWVRSGRKYWAGKFIYPSTAPKSSPFGVKRSYNGGPVTSYHKGLDFAADMGAEVVAPADGKVITTGYEAEGFNVHGNCVILDHGHAVTSIYMHLSKIDVKKGDQVKQGQKIGEVGHTGISTGPHLHWGTYVQGTSVEPELFVNQNVR